LHSLLSLTMYLRLELGVHPEIILWQYLMSIII